MSLANAERVQLKLFVKDEAPKAESLIPVFHSWITEQRLDELMIDVADYSHVFEGPGVVLVGHESDYYFDEHNGRPGILYSRKRGFAGDLEARLRDALDRVQQAAKMLREQMKLDFDAHEMLLRVPDRLHAPNDDATFEQLEAIAARVFEGAAIERVTGRGEPLSARIRR